MTPLWLVLAASVPWSSMGEAARADAMAQVQALPTLRERLLAATEGFLGTPYVRSPLGEGAGRDPDPLLRLDAVDCVTLVEEALALSTAQPQRLEEALTALRYAGAPLWENRLHVMEAQWLPENVKRGLLRDVTAAYGGPRTERATKVLSAATWSAPGGKALGLSADKQPTGTFELDIIPAAAAARALERAPGGLVVVVVRADRPHLVTRVSHVGVLVQGPRGPLLRHASRSFGRVVDEPLARYLSRNLDFGQWTITGLALYEPTLP